MDEYIPLIKLNGKHHLPWVTPKNKKGHSLQKEMGQAYWQYIDNIIDYSEEDNNTERKFKQKKFWSFIKNMRKD